MVRFLISIPEDLRKEIKEIAETQGIKTMRIDKTTRKYCFDCLAKMGANIVSLVEISGSHPEKVSTETIIALLKTYAKAFDWILEDKK